MFGELRYEDDYGWWGKQTLIMELASACWMKKLPRLVTKI
mgnify:FL=1